MCLGGRLVNGRWRLGDRVTCMCGACWCIECCCIRVGTSRLPHLRSVPHTLPPSLLPVRYELGFPQEHFGSTAAWAETVKAEAAELYHAIAGVIAQWVKAFQSKAAAAAGA